MAVVLPFVVERPTRSDFLEGVFSRRDFDVSRDAPFGELVFSCGAIRVMLLWIFELVFLFVGTAKIVSCCRKTNTPFGTPNGQCAVCVSEPASRVEHVFF